MENINQPRALSYINDTPINSYQTFPQGQEHKSEGQINLINKITQMASMHFRIQIKQRGKNYKNCETKPHQQNAPIIMRGGKSTTQNKTV